MRARSWVCSGRRLAPVDRTPRARSGRAASLRARATRSVAARDRARCRNVVGRAQRGAGRRRVGVPKSRSKSAARSGSPGVARFSQLEQREDAAAVVVGDDHGEVGTAVPAVRRAGRSSRAGRSGHPSTRRSAPRPPGRSRSPSTRSRRCPRGPGSRRLAGGVGPVALRGRRRGPSSDEPDEQSTSRLRGARRARPPPRPRRSATGCRPAHHCRGDPFAGCAARRPRPVLCGAGRRRGSAPTGSSSTEVGCTAWTCGPRHDPPVRGDRLHANTGTPQQGCHGAREA